MQELLQKLCTLANESGGGVLETIEPQGIQAVALLLADGRVALIRVDGGGSR